MIDIFGQIVIKFILEKYTLKYADRKKYRMKNITRKILSLLLTAALLCSIIPCNFVSAAGYADGYTGGRNGDNNGILAKGVDLSSWQGDSVDFNQIKAQGYSFVILRAGFATTADSTFEINYSKAKSAGLNVGAYLYSYAEDVQEAKNEASAMRSWLSGKQLEYPVYYDLEEPEIHGIMSKEQLSDIAMAFLDSMAASGWLVGLYSCRSWLEGKLDTARICARYECWLAQYLNSGTSDTYDEYDGICGIWQYSSSGSVEGVPGDTDMDVCFKDYPTICRRYGFNGYTATGATLILTGSAVPPVLKLGQTMTVSGTLTSSSGNLSNVTAGFYNEEGTPVKTKSAGPKAATYDLSRLADGLNSKDLAEGRYYFRVLATNTFETQILMNESVVVSKNGIRTDFIAVPENLKEGDSFKTTGILTATENMIGVTVSVKSADKTILSESAAPNSAKFDLAAFAEKMKFETLSMGTYTYDILASLSTGSVNHVVTESFSVWAKNDPVTVSDLSLKKEYFIGDAITLSGTVSSAKSDMQSCEVSMTDFEGSVFNKASIPSPVKSVDLAQLCKDFSLSDLPAGVYTFRIKALNSGGPQTVTEQKFYVRPDAIGLCQCNARPVLEKGESFFLQGVITSDATPLEYVTVSVVDINGKVHLSAGDVPDGNCYDLAQLRDKLFFSRLMLNDYTLRICAKNGHQLDTVYEAPLTVSEETDRVEWKGEHFDPNGITFYPGTAIGVKGTLTSENSEITEVSAKIYAEGAERPVTSAFLHPGSDSASVASLNQALRFTALAAGEYRIVISATNASGEFTVTDAAFSVSDCPHTNVAYGTKYDATCTRAGAVSDFCCMDCGAKVRSGQRIEMTAHTYRDGVCTGCGRKEFITVAAQKTQQLPEKASRIVIAVYDGINWYALGSEGNAVRIDAPDPTGRISVKADLLWSPELQRDGTVLLRNPFGQLLHFDRNGIAVGSGINNVNLSFAAFGQDMQISLSDEEERNLSFLEQSFILTDETSAVSVFLYLP